MSIDWLMMILVSTLGYLGNNMLTTGRASSVSLCTAKMTSYLGYSRRIVASSAL